MSLLQSSGSVKNMIIGVSPTPFALPALERGVTETGGLVEKLEEFFVASPLH